MELIIIAKTKKITKSESVKKRFLIKNRLGSGYTIRTGVKIPSEANEVIRRDYKKSKFDGMYRKRHIGMR